MGVAVRSVVVAEAKAVGVVALRVVAAMAMEAVGRAKEVVGVEATVEVAATVVP